MYFPIEPKIIDIDRTKNGDYYKKPTQYWFVNCEPEQNIVMRALDYVKTGKITKHCKIDCEYKNTTVRRSMIHPQYAERFIEQYILDVEGNIFF